MAEVVDIVMKSGITEEVTSAFHGIFEITPEMIEHAPRPLSMKSVVCAVWAAKKRWPLGIKISW
jgi:hypothetical protein